MSTPKPIRGARFLKFRCTDCGNCCTDTIVPITDHDVRRLIEPGRPAETFINFYPRREFDDRAPELAWIHLEEGRRVMALKKQPGSEACHFLKELRCSAYEQRPITCRVFPYQVEFDAKGKVNRFYISQAVPCPYQLDGKVNLPQVVRDWDLDDEQDLEYSLKVEEFNALPRPRTRHAFLQFLGLASPNPALRMPEPEPKALSRRRP